MEEIGIKIDTLQAECGSGQFEATFAPVMGIEVLTLMCIGERDFF